MISVQNFNFYKCFGDSLARFLIHVVKVFEKYLTCSNLIPGAMISFVVTSKNINSNVEM